MTDEAKFVPFEKFNPNEPEYEVVDRAGWGIGSAGWPFTWNEKNEREYLQESRGKGASYGEIVEWVGDNLDDPTVCPKDAPCNAAYSMLKSVLMGGEKGRNLFTKDVYRPWMSKQSEDKSDAERRRKENLDYELVRQFEMLSKCPKCGHDFGD